ncbi:MAG TPA: MATE family efflux transporter [Kiritimatiellia bacterium]|nr:MATE family efflux transporter [Kiritimatiellia bacterium]
MPTPRNLLTDPIPRLVRAVAIPASTGYLFNTLFNITDTWYAGRLSTDALGALGLSFPVYFIVLAVASGLSTGVSTLIANALGAGRPEAAQQLATRAIAFTLAASLLLTLGGILLAQSIFHWMGADPEPARLATAYVTVIFLGAAFFNLGQVFNACLIARGDTHTYRNVLLVGVLLNLILDPWFIYGGFGLPPFGFHGIALATILIQALVCAYLFHNVRQRGLLAPLTPRNLRLTLRDTSEILSQSGPAALNMLTIGIGILVITYFLNEHGTHAVAAYSIATRVEQIVLLPVIGLNLAVLAIVGQNNGAGRHDRARETLHVALRYGLYLLLPAFVLLLGLPRFAMALFTPDPDVIRIGTDYLRIAFLCAYAYTILFTMTAALQAIKKPNYAIWIGLYRQLLAPLILIVLLSRVFGLGVWSVWISVLFTTWSAALITVAYTRRHVPPIP